MSTQHTRFGSVWPRIRALLDVLGAAEHRRRLVAGLSGRVVEVGAGDGRMFREYPASVTSVLAVEPEPRLLGIATEAALSAPVPVELHSGTAESIPAPDGSADAVVYSLVLCSVPDQARALAEARRVLAPGGELRFYEHVVAAGGVARVAQTQLDETGIWPAVGGGCHLARDTTTAIERAGFEITQLDRFRFPFGVGPHVLGRAKAPGRPGSAPAGEGS